MNQRRRAFCEAYLVSGNATNAAVKAGYSTRTARSIGQRLLTYVDIQEYLELRNQEISDANTAKMEEVRQFWTAIMRDQSMKPVDRLKSSELLAKAYGAFSEHISGEISVSAIVSDWIEAIPDCPESTKEET